jgi:hypothetical protein
MVNRNFKKLQINGKDIPEGFVTNKIFERRFDNNGNVLLLVVGKTGSGKSWSCMRIAELWYKHRFNEPFPQHNICFSLAEAGKLIRNNNMRKGEFLIVEEAGVIVNSLDFQNKIIKLFHAFLQSGRCKNLGIIFNFPNMSMITKTAKTLAHGVFQTTALDTHSGFVTLKPFALSTNPIFGKTYQKYPIQKMNHHYVQVKRIKIGKPTNELLKVYEERKQKFVDGVLDDFLDAVKDKEEKQLAIPNIWVAIKGLIEKGIHGHVEIAKILNVSQPFVSRSLKRMEENGYFNINYVEKAQNIPLKQIPVLVSN